MTVLLYSKLCRTQRVTNQNILQENSKLRFRNFHTTQNDWLMCTYWIGVFYVICCQSIVKCQYNI
jgi:hypothetical protein